MSALTKKEIAMINIMANNYGIPVIYPTKEYTTTTRKIKSKKRIPQWTFDLAGVIANNRGCNITKIDYIMTGNWGVLPLLTLGVNDYTENIKSLKKLLVSLKGTMDTTSDEERLKNYIRFITAGLNDKLPVITSKEINGYIVPVKPRGNPKFPTHSYGGTDFCEEERQYKMAISVTDNTQTMKYLNQDMLFDAVILDGLSKNPHASEEVLIKVLELLRNEKMDYTNTPEVTYYRIVDDISSVIKGRLATL